MDHDAQALAAALTLLVLGQALLVWGAALVAQVLALRARLSTGGLLAAERGRTRHVRALWSAAALAALALVAVRGDLPLAPVLACLAGAGLLAWSSPGLHDALLGAQGVQRGFEARRFEQLEEWRLTGTHLRFRLRGPWTAVPCPPERRAEIAAALARLAPERESPFQD